MYDITVEDVPWARILWIAWLLKSSSHEFMSVSVSTPCTPEACYVKSCLQRPTFQPCPTWRDVCMILILERIQLGKKKTCTHCSWRNHIRSNGGTCAVKYKAKIILPVPRLFIASCFSTNHILERPDRLKAKKISFFYIYSNANMKTRGHGSVLKQARASSDESL